MLTSVCKHIESMSPLWVKKILRRRSLCSGGDDGPTGTSESCFARDKGLD